MNAYFVMGCVLIFAIRANKRIARMIKNIKETVVEGQPCAENGCKNYLIRRNVDLCSA